MKRDEWLFNLSSNISKIFENCRVTQLIPTEKIYINDIKQLCEFSRAAGKQKKNYLKNYKFI